MGKRLNLWALVSILALLAAGCATSPSARFYILSGIEGMEKAPPAAMEKEATIGVGPVSIPDILDRPQLVTLSGANEVSIAEFDRWSGSYRNEIARVLTENLSVLLPSQRVVSYAWGRRISLDRRITVDIIRLDGALGETVFLKANWALLGENGAKTLLVRRVDISEPVNGGGYAGYVAALSRALAKLSREIAMAVPPSK